jgi:hypothetical protein
MVLRLQKSLFSNRKKVLSVLLGLSLLAALVVTLATTKNAQADYVTGCGYGYNSGGTGFGYGGATHEYGYGDGVFAFGYGDQVCPLSITTSSLTSGTVGSAYSQVLTGTGGATGGYLWSESGSFDGLILSSNGSISGTPSSPGTFPITVTMTDHNGVSTSTGLSLSVSSSSSGGGGGAGGTTTTSTTSTTTTTGPTTTTTPPPPVGKRFFAGKVTGFAEPGKSLLLTIPGAGFYGNPKITSNEVGTRVLVIHDHGTSLVVRIIVRLGSRTGEHTLTIRFADGQTCKANYSVR